MCASKHLRRNRSSIMGSRLAPAVLLLAWIAGPAAAAPEAGAAAPALEGFSAGQQALLERELAAGFDGVIAPALVAQLLARDAGEATVQSLMLRLLPLASRHALPPISDFRVGAVAQGASGALYLGANLEIAGQALAFAVHAEQSALNNALLHGEAGIERLAVTAAPCGHCRQFLNELAGAAGLEVIVAGRAPASLAALLPHAFGPAQLEIENALMAAAPSRRQCPAGTEAPLRCHAQAAQRHSYAPYSGSPAAVALRAGEAVYAGAYVENAAFNPSLPPLLSALDRLRFAGRSFGEIEEALLLERPSARISQAAYTRAVLQSIAPAARLRVLTSGETVP